VQEHHGINLKKLLIRAVVAGLALALVLVVFGAKMANDRNQIWIEIAKTGAQLGILSIIGGGVATALRLLESLREEQRTLNQYRLSVLRDITTSYNQIKAVRRTLRAFGFKAPASPLSPDQVTEFRAQMKALNEAQLALERLKRELTVRPDCFYEAGQIQCELKTAERYIGHVLDDWQEHGVDIVAGVPPTVMTPMGNLQAFLRESDEGFQAGAAEPMERLQALIHTQTVGKC
jgi:hypothetical protein